MRVQAGRGTASEQGVDPMLLREVVTAVEAAIAAELIRALLERILG